MGVVEKDRRVCAIEVVRAVGVRRVGWKRDWDWTRGGDIGVRIWRGRMVRRVRRGREVRREGIVVVRLIEVLVEVLENEFLEYGAGCANPVWATKSRADLTTSVCMGSPKSAFESGATPIRMPINN